MIFKAGDNVRVHTLDWFEKNCEVDQDGDFTYKDSCGYFDKKNKYLYGKIVTIVTRTSIDRDYYRIEENTKFNFAGWIFENELIKKIKQETNWEHYQKEIGNFMNCDCCPAGQYCEFNKDACAYMFMSWAMETYQPKIKKYTMQEIANFMHRFVAKDKIGNRVFIYGEKPYIKNGENIWDSSNECLDISNIVSDVKEHDWTVLVEPQ
jgi:hypothetical protein